MHAGKQGQAFKLLLGSLGRIHPQSIRILTTIPGASFNLSLKLQVWYSVPGLLLGCCRNSTVAGKLAHMSSRGRWPF